MGLSLNAPAWFVVGALLFVMTIVSVVDTRESEPPVVDPNSTEEPEPVEIGPVQNAAYSIPVRALSVLVILLSAGVIVATFIMPWRRNVRTTFILLGALGIFSAGIALSDYYAPEEVSGDERRDPITLPLLLTALLLVASVALVLLTEMDGFAQGSIVLIGILELFVLWGWAGIPGGRTYVNHAIVTLAMAILLASVLLFHDFQKPKAAKA